MCESWINIAMYVAVATTITLFLSSLSTFVMYTRLSYPHSPPAADGLTGSACGRYSVLVSVKSCTTHCSWPGSVAATVGLYTGLLHHFESLGIFLWVSPV